MYVNKTKKYILLHLSFLMLSMSGVFAKLAAQNLWFSKEWLFFYFCVLVIMCVYALLWQQIIKKFTLNTAFCNKAVTIIWGFIWGNIFFNEAIDFNMVLGGIVVILGIIIVVTSDKKDKKEEE